MMQLEYRKWLVGMIASGDWASQSEHGFGSPPYVRREGLITRAELYVRQADAIIEVLSRGEQKEPE